METNNSTVCFKELRHDSAHFSYYLIKGSISYEGNILDSYSIKAEYSDGSDGALSVGTAHDITTDEATAREFFRMIADGLVTPTTLNEVAEDLIASL